MARFPKILPLLVLLLLTLTVPGQTAQAQDDGITDILSINVQAGFGGYFRANRWFPVRVRLQNQGADLSGRLVVRPETSGDAIYNTYSTPVDLPSGSQQVVTLYVAARSHAREIRVELITDEGGIATTGSGSLRGLDHRDRLYAAISDTPTGAPDLTSVAVAGYVAQQALWDIEEIPNKVGALDSVDVILFSDVDTGTLAQSQRDAIRTWVLRGGHLIVTGGADWQSTASGLEDILPLVPNNSDQTDELAALVDLAGREGEELQGEVIYARGELREDAIVLAATGDNEPLIARRHVGNGTIDYISIDLSGQPIRDWEGLDGLWFSLLTSTQARPGWTDGFLDYESAITAAEIIPGINLLPAALSLIGFLLAYIALIGPLNYIILSRLNRREIAWFTIPVLIVLFSVMAWSFGAELRGNDVTLSRLSVVQTWPDSEEAQLDQLIGLLAPRRGDYSLEVNDDRLMRPISSDQNDFSFLSTNSAVDIRQAANFEAVDFPVDASFIQVFSTNGTITKPDIGGRLGMSYEEETIVSENTMESVPSPTNQTVSETKVVARLQGTIFNDADFTLHNPIILARGQTHRVGSDLEPGDLETVNLMLPGNTFAPPAPLELSDFGGSGSRISGFNSSFNRYGNPAIMSALQVMGEEDWQQMNFGYSFGTDQASLETRRRQSLLTSFMIDQFNSTGRGDRVYLVGWADLAPTEERVNDGGFNSSDSTLYIIELTVDTPDSGQARIASDQFTWVTREREGLSDVGPNNFQLGSSHILSVRYTPVPTARLSRVDELTVFVTFNRMRPGETQIQIWDWEAGEWVAQMLTNRPSTSDSYITFRGQDIDRFVGPNNVVEVRVEGVRLGQSSVQNLAIEQTGRF